MTLAATLLPLAVLLPLTLAALLLAVGHWLPPRVADVCSIIGALALAALCGWLACAGSAARVVHWFGGWGPQLAGRPGVVLGISFSADPASAALAAFCALLFAMALLYAWAQFDDTHGHFHVLMLLFLGAIVGFCLTADLFNMFVWFELMSVAAFALTGYPLGRSSLEGALNFTITNALASFLMLAGVGLLYARTGTLDMLTIGAEVAHLGRDPLVFGSFCLIGAALLTKGAILPFHMWLADAHAVAPSAVSVTLSGAMVPVALFELSKLLMRVFLPDAALAPLLQESLLWLGVATALIGGLMTWAQRHFKRLLAFSTISHMGVIITVAAAASPSALAGLQLYIVGHGLVKGALFMIAGMLLALRASADEISLYGAAHGRVMAAAGVATMLGAVLFSDAPWGLMHDGGELIGEAQGIAAVPLLIELATALTGAALLRAAARIFAGWSGSPGAEITAPTEREREKIERPAWVMLLPCYVLLAIALLPGKPAEPFLRLAAARLITPDPGAAARLLMHLHVQAASVRGSSRLWIASVLLAAAAFGLSLLRRRATRPLSRRLAGLEAGLFRGLQNLHSGIIGDYIVWMLLGLAAIALSTHMG